VTPERWRRIRELFERASELAPEERAAFLARECGGDAELAAEVEGLLSEDAAAPADFVSAPDPGRPALLGDGVRLGDFRLLAEIGRGAMGVVYRARQESVARDVAVKVVARSLLPGGDELARFQREVRAVGRLDHPGIARILVVGEEADLSWFAMELVPGHSLAEELRHQRAEPLPGALAPLLPRPGTADHVRAVARLVVDVADALDHAHGRGVVHRDIKPSNLLLTPQGQVKIVDFGIAKDASFGTLTRSDQIVGSVPYMSPEQARLLKARVDERTDVYSLGVVLYELLTGRRPFEGVTTLELLTKIRGQEPRPVRGWNPRVPRDLAVICAKAMAKEPAERYAGAGALRDDLLRFLRFEAIEARPPSLALRVRRFARRRRVLVVALVVAAGATGLGWALRRALFPGSAPALLSVSGPRGLAVALRRLDPITSQPLAPSALGHTPLARVPLEPGYVRVLVEDGPAGAPRAFSRWLDPGVEVTLALDEPRRPRDPLRGMVRFAGGSLEVDEPDVSPLYGRSVEVEPFWLDEAEVSVREYREFLAARPDVAPPSELALLEAGAASDELPMVNVSWEEARAYAEWRGKRLPTHAEWMWAARGPRLRPRPWSPAGGWRGATRGARFVEGSRAEQLAQYLAHAAPVRSSPEACTPEGLFHMLGNATEWTESAMAHVRGVPPRPDPLRRILCGGFWDCEERGRELPDFEHWGLGREFRGWTRGFRCARDGP